MSVYKLTIMKNENSAGFAGNDLRIVYHKRVSVKGLELFYREAGDPLNPVILLLHGFPSSSHMFRDLINDLSDSYHLIAPDYPGFGQSEAPSPEAFEYSFDNLALIINGFINELNLSKFSLYVQDYGGPIGFRIATLRPELIEALIIQNANAYNEGLGEALAPLVAYIQNPDETTIQPVKDLLTIDGTKWQYTEGADDITKISPDSYVTDQYYLDRPGNKEIQWALIRNYGTNLPLYVIWQQFFRTHKPPTVFISAKNDKLFIQAGAEAYKTDIKDAQISLLNGGHFVLEEKHAEAAVLIKDFRTRKGIQ